ncbi:MAG: AgmX/PglI C-terminal domain-containing protein [Myxococcales bacterium]|nr:AgmX/PglI C-terminal domain-containing protein [Myxococcales bacterium]
MSGGSILAIIGGLIALLGPMILPFITVDEEEIALRSFHVMTGMVSIALAVATISLAWLVLKKRKQPLGWPVAIAALAQIGLMAVTYANVWKLVPCQSMGLQLCDPATGGLIDQTLVTLDIGLVAVVLGSILAFFGGLIVVGAHAEYNKDERFLRVLLSWDGHIVAERVLFRPAPVTVGEAQACSFQIAAGGMASHVLLDPVGTDKYRLVVPKGLEGKLHVGGETKEASSVGGSVEIGHHDAGVLSFENGVDIAFQYTGAETGSFLTSAVGKDIGLMVSFTGVAAVMLIVVTAMLSSLHSRRRLEAEEDLEAKAKTTIEVTLEEEEKTDEIKPDGDEEDTTAKKAGGEEGKFGDPDKDKQSKVPKMDGPMRDKIDVKNLGIAKVLGGQQALTGALGNIMAGDTGALTTKMAVAMSGEGGELVIGQGSGGMGFRGTGSGGGGQGYGRLHGLGAIDTGGGTGRNANIGLGRKTAKKVAKISIAQGESTGGCDKGDIAKNVRARASALRACYEVQLLTKPDLSGKLTMQWTITGEGTVANAKLVNDTMSNDQVSDCVMRAIQRIRFLKPEAGICVIQWPFVFSPG